MKPISVLNLLIVFVAAGLLGVGYSNWAVGNGFRIPVSPLTISFSLVVASAVLLALAIPIWRYKKALKKLLEAKDGSVKRPVPVDPFYAVRVLLLAKASALAAAMFIGWHTGVLIQLFSAPVIAVEAIGPNLSAGLIAIGLLIAAFVVQAICRLPSDSGPKDGAVPA